MRWLIQFVLDVLWDCREALLWLGVCATTLGLLWFGFVLLMEWKI